jgi:hypothetical protein
MMQGQKNIIFLPSLKLVVKKLLELLHLKKCVCIPRSFLVIDVCNQGNTLCSPRKSKNATSVSSVKRGGIKRNTSIRMAVNLLEIQRGYLPSVRNMLCPILLFHTLLLWYQQLTAFCYFGNKEYTIITAPMSPMWLH